MEGGEVSGTGILVLERMQVAKNFVFPIVRRSQMFSQLNFGKSTRWNSEGPLFNIAVNVEIASSLERLRSESREVGPLGMLIRVLDLAVCVGQQCGEAKWSLYATTT